MKRFFSQCRTAEELKKLYHKLAKKYHSDNTNGNDDMMKSINAEYTEMWEKLKDIHFSYEKQEYWEETGDRKTSEVAEEFIHIVTVLSNLDLSIEMCGSWLWISGNTLDCKDVLKAEGCRWSKSKHKWYFTHNPYRKPRRNYSMNQIRDMFGSKDIDTKEFYREKVTM